MDMYGLPQARILANKHLIKNLAPRGYEPVKYTPGLWRHKDKNIYFALCVDEFLINNETK